MQRLEVSGAVRHIYESLGFKGLITLKMRSGEEKWRTSVLITRIFGSFKCHSESQTTQRQTEGKLTS